jgi:hypothetical protein
MKNIIKVGLAILLFICLLDMPYGYYQLVRFIAFGVFVYLGFKEFENSNQSLGFIYLLLAILFQPIFKIALGRELWNIVDVIVGLGLLISLFVKKIENELV